MARLRHVGKFNLSNMLPNILGILYIQTYLELSTNNLL